MLMTAPMLTPKDFEFPAIMLSGVVDHGMYLHFKNCLSTAPQQGLVVVEISTLGGDPEIARMMGEDIRFHSDLYPERRLVFLGKTAVYSAGATFMSFFAVENRYLTRGARVMIHERKMDKQLHVTGPLTTCIASVRAMLNELEHSIAIQNEGFENLVRGSSVTMDEVLKRAPANWYIEAQEAKALGLIAEVI